MRSASATTRGERSTTYASRRRAVQLSLGPLASGAVSSWHPVGAVHRYPAVEASGPGIDLMHLPFDGDAQADLPAGRYTYVLRLEGGRLVVGLEED